MREGSLETPTRHPLAWQDEDFYDQAKIEAELRRVFDICHGCRRCFNLCDTFPRLFDLIDNRRPANSTASIQQGFQAGRRCLHAVRHVLHDEVPVCAAARVRPRFPASDAARPRRRGPSGTEWVSPTAELAKTDRNGKLAALAAPARQLGQQHGQQAHPPAAGEIRRPASAGGAAEIPFPHLRRRWRPPWCRKSTNPPPRSAARRCSMPPAS